MVLNQPLTSFWPVLKITVKSLFFVILADVCVI